MARLNVALRVKGLSFARAWIQLASLIMFFSVPLACWVATRGIRGVRIKIGQSRWERLYKHSKVIHCREHGK